MDNRNWYTVSMKNFGVQVSIFIVIVSITLIGLLVGVIIGEQVSEKNEVIVQRSPYIKLVDTSNWKIFRSNNLGFQMKIPAIYGTSSDDGPDHVAFIQNPDIFVFLQSDKSIREVIKNEPIIVDENIVILKRLLGGYPSLEFELDSYGYSKAIVVKHPFTGKTILIRIVESDYDSRDLITMLSTFKFIEI